MASSASDNNNGQKRKNEESIPEELARKRARDRKSQRAMRERVRWVTEELEQRVAHLSQALADETAAHQAHVSVSAAETERLRAENRMLRMQLDSMRTEATRIPPLPDVSHTPARATPSTASSHSSQPTLPTIRPGSQRSLAIPSAAKTSIGNGEKLWDNKPPVAYQAVPWNTEPVCISDRIVQGYIEWRRSGIGDFQHPDHPEPLNIAAILAPDPNIKARTPQGVSSVVADILLAYHEIDTPPKKVSCLYVIYKLLNWLIYRNETTYNQLPGWLRPSPIQLKVQHPAWIDRVPWPSARSYLIEHPEITFDSFAAVYSSSFELTWPYSPTHIVVPTSPSSSPATGSAQVAKHAESSRQPPDQSSTYPQGAQPQPQSQAQLHGLSSQSQSRISSLAPYVSMSTGDSTSDSSTNAEGISINPVYEQHLRQLRNWTVGDKFRRKFPELGEIVDWDCRVDYGS